MRRLLSVFDFDHTIVNNNSDVVLRDLLPKSVLEDETLKCLRPSWTSYMAAIFRQFPANGIDRNLFEATCKNLKHTDGMKELLTYLKNIDSDVIILSDANSEIISTWLKFNYPHDNIKVYTNPAYWEEEVLNIEPFEEQEACNLCSKNICKGSILQTFLETRHYEFIIYTGDGRNDLCPSKKLKATDYVFPRSGYALEKLLQTTEIDASIHVWKSALEIKDLLDIKLQRE